METSPKEEIKLSVKHKQRQNGGRKKQDLADKVDFNRISELFASGLTDKQLAVVCEVDERTIRRWKADERFLSALKKGKDIADARVERSLYERATGYEYQAVKIMQYEGQIITQEYTEHCPPDPTSMIFWLKNRKPVDWKDRKEVSTTLNINQIDFNKLSPAELARIVSNPELILSTQN